MFFARHRGELLAAEVHAGDFVRHHLDGRLVIPLFRAPFEFRSVDHEGLGELCPVKRETLLS